MTTMRRCRVSWDGLPGLPGLSTFYFGVASPNVSALVTFFTAIKALFPSALSWTIPSSGDEIDDASGALTGGWVGSGGGTVTATGGAGAYAAGTGCQVQWQTGVVAHGRRIKGSTFLVPTVVGMYDTNGTLTSANQTTVQTAANALVASGVAWGIWQRPKKDPVSHVVTRVGLYAATNAATVPDRVTSLRTRRT